MGHQYTPENFGEQSLKLNDRHKADILFKAAKKLGFYAKMCLVTSYISGAPTFESDWLDSIEQIQSDLNEFVALLNDPATDLYTPFRHGDGQNLLREAMLIADHTSFIPGK